MKLYIKENGGVKVFKQKYMKFKFGSNLVHLFLLFINL